MLHREGIIVWLPYERTFGRAYHGIGAHMTLINYNLGGDEYEVFLDNDEFEIVEDGIEYDAD